MRKVSEKIRELNSEFDQLHSLNFDNLQSFDSLKSRFELNVGQLIGTSYCLLVKETDNHLQFEVKIEPGVENGYDFHWHDCLEVCTVVSGMMTDATLTNEYAVAGEQIVYKPYSAHTPYNPGEETLNIVVDFYRIT